jgi:branched-chain amino acid transport system substrate-binding protein
MEIGQVLNQRYTLTARLGKGAMGIVYRALDQQTGQAVAVKVLAADLTFNNPDDAGLLERFRREGEALRQLKHPNIVGFGEVFEQGEQHVIVMEYVPGGSLHALLRQGPIPVDRTRRMALELCDALTRAHHLNIIHRDLKPENVLLAEDGTPKLTDFGVAHLTAEGTRLTGTGTQVGTPFYMSPEAWEGKPLDAQTDIWSLGIVLYEMLSGQVPFSGDTIVSVMNKVLNAPLPDLRALRPDVPPGLAQIVQRMLARDKGERYQSMREVAADLERGQPLTGVAAQQPRAAAGPTRAKAPPTLAQKAPAPAREPSADRRPLWPWLVGAGVIVALLALGGLGLGVGWMMVSRQSTKAATPTSALPTRAEPTRTAAATDNPRPGSTPSQSRATASSPTTAAPNKTLALGVLLPVSGPNAALGATASAGVQMAVDEWNAQGGVLGATLLPSLADGQCAADPAVTAAQHLFRQEGVHYLVGEVCSAASIPVAALAEQQGVVQISPASTAPKVTLNDDGTTKAYVFRACFMDPFQGNVMANFALGQQLQRAFVIWDQSSDYSRGLANNFISAFEKGGGTVVGQEAYAAETQDFAALLARVAAQAPQVLFVPDMAQRVNLIARQAKAQKLAAVLMGGDGWEGDLDLETLEGGYYSTHFSPLTTRAETQAWIARYRAKYSRAPDAIAALAYDATNLLLTAIRQTGADDPARVKDTLAGLTFDGITGRISFDAQHNPVKSAVIMQVRAGQRVYAGTVEP